MPKIFSDKEGLTLVELLIAIAIIALLGVVSVPALKSFNNNQQFENSASDLKNALRIAQSKAISSIVCSNNNPSANWLVEFTSINQITTYCTPSDGSARVQGSTTIFPPGISITSILSCSPINGTQIIFQNLSMSINCNGLLASTVITLTNTANNNTRIINIGQGGIIGD